MIKPKEHHSVADWDFSSSITRTLDNAIYVSPPSSLRISGPALSMVERSALCRIPETQVLPEGELRCWFRQPEVQFGQNFLFRNQAALGTANFDDCYMWSLRWNQAYFYRVLGGTGALLRQFAITRTANTWAHWRTVWWNGINPGGQPSLAVDLYEEVTGNWVQRNATFYHTDNEWKDSAVNRCGIGGYERRDMTSHFDDTEIWGPP
ncbi:hypothetical protein ES705_20128 [subsurface metagenome]